MFFYLLEGTVSPEEKHSEGVEVEIIGTERGERRGVSGSLYRLVTILCHICFAICFAISAVFQYGFRRGGGGCVLQEYVGMLPCFCHAFNLVLTGP